MLIRATFAAALLAGGLAHADELAPMQGRSVVLGDLSGIAYVTNEADGPHLVATLAPADGGTPLRVSATLAVGQPVVLSVPRGPGEPAIEVTFRREGTRVFVDGGNPLPHGLLAGTARPRF